MNTPLVQNESIRLEALGRYRHLDMPSESALDELTALAARLCGTPYALISFVEEQRLWFKSRFGLSDRETPREGSFCTHAILRQDLFMVPDAAKDERFADGPTVKGGPRIRFYAGAPLVSADGFALGTLCVMDWEPRCLDALQQGVLRVLARQVMAQLEWGRRVEESVASERRYRALFDANPHPMWVYDLETLRFLAVNDAALSHYGFRRDEFLAMTIADIRPREDVPRLMNNLARVGEHALDQAGVWRHRKKDGTIIEVEITSHVLDYQGRQAELVLAHDVTARRLVEQRIRRLNRTYAILSEINQLIVRERRPDVILDGVCRIAVEQGGFLMAWVGLIRKEGEPLQVVAHAGATADTCLALNRILQDPELGCAFTGRALETNLHALCNDISADPLAEAWRGAALERGYRAMVSLPLTVKQRCVGVFNLYASEAGFFDAEELRLLDELATDIAFGLEGCEREQERQHAQDLLRSSEERFRLMIENASDLVTVLNASGLIRFQSPTSKRVLGFAPEDLVGRNAFGFIHPDDAAATAAALKRALTNPVAPASVDLRFRHQDGSWRVLQAMGRRFPSHNDENLVVVNSRDVTESRQLEEQVRQSQKLEAIGQLAGGVAHDFNNILAVILMQAELSATLQNIPLEVQEGLREIRISAERAANLTRQLLLFSRRQAMQPRQLDLNEIVTSLAKMLQRILGEDVRLQLHLHPTPLITHADAGMLDQVLMNLAVNARDAMPQGGHLTIGTGLSTVDSETARLRPEIPLGRYVWVRVSDSGTGIPPEALPHIFDPFFTTKEPGKGTGLGLATVFGIVQQHHGWINVESDLGHGSRFQVHLPACEPSAENPSGEAERPRVRGGTETILLVEDDPPVRSVTRATLEKQGYHVIEAADGNDALRIWQEHRHKVRLLLTDLVMPGGVSGYELAQRLKAEQPGLKVLYTSGYSAEIAGRDLELRQRENLLQKPCPPDRLLHHIRRCLDA